MRHVSNRIRIVGVDQLISQSIRDVESGLSDTDYC